MSHAPTGLPFARTEVLADGTALVTIGGAWELNQPLPPIVIKGDRAKVVAEGLTDFDSSLPAWLYANFKNIRQLDISTLPARRAAVCGRYDLPGLLLLCDLFHRGPHEGIRDAGRRSFLWRP